MTRKEQAAKMRDGGASIADIAAHFGWKISSTPAMISQGRRIDYYNSESARFQRKRYALRRRMARDSLPTETSGDAA